MKITIAKGVTVKELVIGDGAVIKIGHGFTGAIGGVPLVIPHAFCDLTADLAEVTPEAILTYVSDHATEVELSKDKVILTDTKELFFKLVI